MFSSALAASAPNLKILFHKIDCSSRIAAFLKQDRIMAGSVQRRPSDSISPSGSEYERVDMDGAVKTRPWVKICCCVDPRDPCSRASLCAAAAISTLYAISIGSFAAMMVLNNKATVVPACLITGVFGFAGMMLCIASAAAWRR